MATVTHCDICDKAVPAYGGFRLTRAGDVQTFSEVPDWDLCSRECLHDLAYGLMSKKKSTA